MGRRRWRWRGAWCCSGSTTAVTTLSLCVQLIQLLESRLDENGCTREGRVVSVGVYVWSFWGPTVGFALACAVRGHCANASRCVVTLVAQQKKE
eukprot:2672017-Prymnesium_polylepis.1